MSTEKITEPSVEKMAEVVEAFGWDYAEDDIGSWFVYWNHLNGDMPDWAENLTSCECLEDVYDMYIESLVLPELDYDKIKELANHQTCIDDGVLSFSRATIIQMCDQLEELAAIKASFRKYKNDAQAENKLLRDAKKELDFTKDTLVQWLGENKWGWSADDVLEIIKHTHFDEIELRKAITAKALKDNNG